MTIRRRLLMAFLSCLAACKGSVQIDGETGASSGGGGGGSGGSGGSDGQLLCAPSACSDLDWANWPIPSAPSEGASNPVTYDIAPDVVVDPITQLTWQRAAAPGTYNLDMANAYCAGLSLGGFTDWRLPTRIELVSIVDDTAADVGINASAFPDTPQDYTWTSTHLLTEPSSAVWAVHFGGYDYYSNAADTSNQMPARCVRGGLKAPSCRYAITETTAHDTATGLTWQRQVESGALTWSDAKAYCEVLAQDGGGWRLPAVKELLSLVDLCHPYPVVNSEAFPGTPPELFWSSTAVAGTTGSAWFVYFGEGNADSHDMSTPSYARCVR